ncbi:hypothetical protein [Amycolatopsis sp. 195334CR]|uniref:hypothetical protein n=1 Tax=Amycolatopsis sp. 195334CR TaxID=2814588 RepID=UPI001A8F87C1|nr:hypothetical protein [Amycolatopsis sp. 195334CR]MBN6041502.1 hypothetical protein [Amycolatopsis sp. 195334CR]
MRKAVVVLLSGALVACAPAPIPAPPAWSELTPPSPGARVLGITGSGEEILLTGSVPGPDGRSPAAWLGTPEAGWRALPLHTGGGYGAQAELVEPSAGGGRLLALGRAYGGAHGNARLTIWSGDPTGLTDHPQPFELLGGPRAMAVNGTATTPGASVLSGQWEHPAAGAGAAVWVYSDGQAWSRLDEARALLSSPGAPTRALGVAATGPGFTAVGDVRADRRFSPLVWTSGNGRDWQRADLPRPADSGDVSASRIACTESACVATGLSRSNTGPQRLACWHGSGGTWSLTGGPDLDPAQLPEITGLAFDGEHVLTTGELGGHARLWTGCGVDRPLPEPATRAVARPLGDRILVSTGEKLWLSAGAAH